LAGVPAYISIGIDYTWGMATVNIRETLLQEFNTLSPAYYSDVLDFIGSLKTNRQLATPETMLLSESALSKNWDTEEEDKVWANL
jgi:hypothetical protein